MSIERKVQNETGRNPYRIGANVLLLVAFFLLFHPLLSRGSLMYQPTISHWLTAGAFVPLVLRPWRRNHPFAENHTRLYAAVSAMAGRSSPASSAVVTDAVTSSKP